MDNGGPASEKTLLDEFAGQALKALAREDFATWGDVASEAYEASEAMIAEKRRREAIENLRHCKDMLGPAAKMEGGTAPIIDAEIERLEKGHEDQA